MNLRLLKKYGPSFLLYLSVVVAATSLTLYFQEKKKTKICKDAVAPEDAPESTIVPGERVPRDSVITEIVPTNTGYALGYTYHYPAKFDSLAIVVEDDALNSFKSVDFAYSAEPMPLQNVNVIPNVQIVKSGGGKGLNIIRVPKSLMTYEGQEISKVRFATFFLHLNFVEDPSDTPMRKRERLSSTIGRILRNSAPTSNKIVYHQYLPDQSFIWQDYDRHGQ